MPVPSLPRRRLLAGSIALPLLQGCAQPFATRPDPATAPAAAALLERSAAAHGSAALARLHDVNVSYAGQWRGLVNRLQPVLVDAGFRGRSEERLLLGERLVGQAHAGPDGRKQVVRTGDAVRVWFNGAETQDPDRRAAAALVADAYRLFLLGPMLLAGPWAADRALTFALNAPERIDVAGRTHDCDVLRVGLAPGVGLSAADQLALYVDRDESLMRRVRFTLDGLEGTRGAVAEIDAFDHVSLHGVRWPTGFHERLLRPLPLPVHDWRLTGLDVDRGLDRSDIGGIEFAGRAIPPAAPLP